MVVTAATRAHRRFTSTFRYETCAEWAGHELVLSSSSSLPEVLSRLFANYPAPDQAWEPGYRWNGEAHSSSLNGWGRVDVGLRSRKPLTPARGKVALSVLRSLQLLPQTRDERRDWVQDPAGDEGYWDDMLNSVTPTGRMIVKLKVKSYVPDRDLQARAGAWAAWPVTLKVEEVCLTNCEDAWFMGRGFWGHLME